ncbi:MAG: endosialidase [Lachnospiraceae bacterium]|nr:endosialidase [Lachnospiraceae bacterium]
MAAIEELIRTESDGSISFGNHQLKEKAKKEDYESSGDIYKVKTYSTMTKLEKNGMFLYESVPGTSVSSLNETEDGVSFTVSGSEDAQVTVGLQDDSEYDVTVNGDKIGRMKTNMGGKLVVSLELSEGEDKEVKITKA